MSSQKQTLYHSPFFHFSDVLPSAYPYVTIPKKHCKYAENKLIFTILNLTQSFNICQFCTHLSIPFQATKKDLP